MKIFKYPRTRHIEGSRLQYGDSADDQSFAGLKGQKLVVEEKVDGANCAISFHNGQMRLQSRGHFLTSGGRERHFALLKSWAACHAEAFYAVLGERYIMYGEWLYAKHTVFYDALPHYFMEFDVLDQSVGEFLSTSRRRELLSGLPIMPVPVLQDGLFESLEDITALVKPSLYKTVNWREALNAAALQSGSRLDFVEKQTEDSDFAEGLYIKLEDGGVVKGRFKFVRADFVQAILDGDSHWHERPILPNRLADGVDIFAPQLGLKGAYDETV